MRTTLVTACLFAFCGFASASYINDYTSLTNVSNLSVAGPPFMDPSGTAVNTTTTATGYSMLFDTPFGTGPAMDVTGHMVVNSVHYTGPATGVAVFWFRIWVGNYTGDGPFNGWVRTRRPAYAVAIDPTTGWHTIVHDIDNYNDLQYYDGIPEFDRTSVFGFSQGTQFWSEAEVPYTWGMHYLEVSPAPSRQIKGISLGDYGGPAFVPDKDEWRASIGIVQPVVFAMVKVVPAGGNPNAPVETIYPSIGENGQMTVATVAPNGTYDLYISARKPDTLMPIQYRWLSRIVPNVVIGDTGATINMALPNGDIDLDGMISVFDYNALSDAFDSTSADPNWNEPDLATGLMPSQSDLDGDNAVTVFDYNILSANFDLVSDF